MEILSPFFFLIAVGSTGLAVFLFIVLGNVISSMVEDEDRRPVRPQMLLAIDVEFETDQRAGRLGKQGNREVLHVPP